MLTHLPLVELWSDFIATLCLDVDEFWQLQPLAQQGVTLLRVINLDE